MQLIFPVEPRKSVGDHPSRPPASRGQEGNEIFRRPQTKTGRVVPPMVCPISQAICPLRPPLFLPVAASVGLVKLDGPAHQDRVGGRRCGFHFRNPGNQPAMPRIAG
jgi:hypothetical protein